MRCENPSSHPAPTRVNFTNRGAALSGAYGAVVERESGLPRHTVYRPATLPTGTASIPIVSWGNGGCSANGSSHAEFLAQIASHGYIVIANGAPNGSGSDPDNGSTHLAAIDWAIDESTDPCSQYYNRINAKKVAVMGYSCGGLMALNASADPRLSTVVAMNSGLFSATPSVYNGMHTPVAYFNGGPSDIAYENGRRDYQNISRVPVYLANLPVGHGGTYNDDNGGEFAKVGVAWLNWHLKGDQGATGRGMFLGTNCGICRTNWTIESKNF